jgi:hypothetical protein
MVIRTISVKREFDNSKIFSQARFDPIASDFIVNWTIISFLLVCFEFFVFGPADGPSILIGQTAGSGHLVLYLVLSVVALVIIGCGVYQATYVCIRKRLIQFASKWESMHPLADLFASHPNYSISREQKTLVVRCKRGEARHVIETQARDYVMLVAQLLDDLVEGELDRELATSTTTP